MISVSSSDARSEIGLGFAGIEEEMMDESDFEEESTHSYVSCVDPDVALSYIDEKLENVLGHFQKDFEGGVSAENLGAKFGGYGSFLSMYQRSPACKSPLEVQNQVVARSTCSASSVVPEASGSTSKAPASDVLVNLKKFVNSSNIGTPDSKQVSLSKTSSSAPSNHKTLRLRIKVGSSDLSSLKDVSTYNTKQGLNIPPSTSRVNCLSEVDEGLLNGILDSPTKILMAMVSFPLRKDQLLSPLSDDLIQLGKREKILKDAVYVSVNKSDSKGEHGLLGVSDVQKRAGKFSTANKAKLKERVKYMPPLNRLDENHFVSDTEKEAAKQSCEELVSKTLKLPLLSCLSPSYIHPAKEVDIEGRLRETNNTDLDAALMVSKPKLEDNVVAVPDYTSMDKVSESETRNEEKNLKSKLPKAQKSQKPEDVYGGIFGDSGVSKEEKKSSPILEAKKENGLKESFNNLNNDEEACNHLHLVRKPDTNHLIKSRDLNEDRHNIKQSVRSEVKNKHSVEGGMEPERELSGTCKKVKTGKSRFSAVAQPGSNKKFDGANKTTITQASAQNVKDIANASSHDRHDDRKRKQKETKESGDCMRLKEAAVMESSGGKVRTKKRLKGSSCDGKELPFSSESCDRDKRVSQENGRDSASHLCKDLVSEITKTNVHEAKGCVESVAPSALRVLDPRERKSGRISERDDHYDADSNAGDTLKRCRDGEGYSTIDKPGTTKKAAETSKDNDLPSTRKATHSWDKESADGENCSIEKYKSKKPGRYTGDNCTEGDFQRKNRNKQNGSAHNDHVGSSPSKRESTSQAISNSIKEATALKHMADRLKNDGSDHESTGFYFQAALKFLHGASLLESSGTEHGTHTSIARSMDIYGSTAKLCEFCAHEYEKNKDMGAAALAYKCMEIAYLRITYSTHGNISNYRYELHAALQVIPSGESPSFASDGEYSNQTLAAEKVALPNTVRSSPRVTGNHVISSANNSSISQLLAFSKNVSFAMDASRKAQIAFAAAKGKSFDAPYSIDGVTCIKRALDYNFQDMEKLLHAVRVAMESINR
ncbi:uncharacterized protein LOC18994557 isoform X2 [Eutrema salsugineum]|uniref:uncharacterized protein LOC18994557 isoform X2 n=1 Tax=Eutrema salsugineum TaxID=72664 RepID=UPI000CED3304|nr:uncharacterized protein LOC18994557 isoform X2 [Eutrema salsugineum]